LQQGLCIKRRTREDRQAAPVSGGFSVPRSLVKQVAEKLALGWRSALNAAIELFFSGGDLSPEAQSRITKAFRRPKFSTRSWKTLWKNTKVPS
jgi:hypothetical protein